MAGRGKIQLFLWRKRQSQADDGAGAATPPAKTQGAADFELLKKKDTTQFILYVGDRRGYKNFNNFIYAISLSSQLKNKIKVICFGGGNFSKDEMVKFKDLGFKEKMILYYDGKNSELEKLYLNAALLVYPSKYEGFGMPIIEAQKVGRVIITSRKSSIPEVAGKGGHFVDPEDIVQIKEGFLKLINNDSQNIMGN